MANGQTMATVLVRCLDVCVTRHLLDASLESPPLMVVVALSWMAVPLSSSAMAFISSAFIRDTPGSPVSGSVTHCVSPSSTPSPVTGILPPCSLPTATVNASER